MLVFRYDKTFRRAAVGPVRCLFAARVSRGADRPRGAEPLFTERVHDVVTDEAHASRVWRGLERRLIARARSMFVYAWHGEQAGGDLLMLRCLRRVFDEGGGVVADQADPDMKALHRLALRVSHERERMKQFVRLQKAADGTYFAAVTPLSTTPRRSPSTISPTASPTSGGLSTTANAITDIITTAPRAAASRWRTTGG